MGQNDEKKRRFASFENDGVAAVKANLAAGRYTTSKRDAIEWLNLQEEANKDRASKLDHRAIEAAEATASATSDIAADTKRNANVAKWAAVAAWVAAIVAAISAWVAWVKS